MKRLRGKWNISFVVALWAATTVLLPVSARAVGLMTIQGYITDRGGRPLQGVRVADGQQSVYSDASGHYVLEESRVQNYTIAVSKAGLDSTSRRVTPIDALADVNFQLTYILRPSVSPQSFNNSPANTLQITVTSYGPPGSCVTWTDASSGTVVALTLSQGAAGGQSSWTGSYTVSAGSEDGNYSYSSVAKDCGNATALTKVMTGQYAVDSVPPSITLIAPLDNGNTLLTSQPIVARIEDFFRGEVAPGGSGVDPASLTVLVRDVGGQETEQRPTPQFGAPLLRSGAATLTPGVEYVVTITARDKAANEAGLSGTFLVMREALTSPAGDIGVTVTSAAPTAVQPGQGLATQDLYLWDSVPATIGGFSVTLRDTKHAGDGKVLVKVPTSQARVSYTISGVPGLPVTVLEPDTVGSVPYAVDTTGAVTASVPAGPAFLGRLTALVPKGADRESVRLSLTTPASGTSFQICPDPTAGPAGCSPDALASIGVHFSVALDPNLIDGVWAITTGTGTYGTDKVTLQTGTIPPDGRILASAASSRILATTTDYQFVIRGYKRIDSSTAWVAAVSSGPSPGQVAAGLWANLGAPTSQRVNIYDSPEQALAVSECGATCSGTYGADPEVTPTTDTLATPPVPGEGSSTTTASPVVEDGNLPSQRCVQTNSCGLTPIAIPARSPGECSVSPGLVVCTTSARDIPGVRAMRGYSHRPAGSRNWFHVDSGNEQQWQNGYRTKAGPFSVSGTTIRTFSSSTRDEWPRRGDCWLDSPQYNDPDCSGYGRHSKRGNDTWRWEKNLVTVCAFPYPFCDSYVEETLREKSYDGGQRENGPEEFVNYYANPVDIEANRWGSWSKHIPGARITRVLGGAVTYGNSAAVSVNFPEAHSSATFESSVTNRTAVNVTNINEFRVDLPWFYVGPGWTGEDGRWYRYDNGTSWRWEYWSCKWGAGWSRPGGTSCWPR